MNQVKVEPFHIIGITVRTTNENGKGAEDIGALWQRFMTEGVLQKIPNKLGNEVYSVYTEYAGDHTQPYTTLLGCKVAGLDEVPEGLTGKSFGGGTYEKFVVQGDLADGIVANQWMKIWEMDLPRTYTADFEIFGEKAQNPQDAEVDILIAVN